MRSSIIIINKNDEGIKNTLTSLYRHKLASETEVIVIDASNHRLDWIKKEFPKVIWKNFENKHKISIPEQRNVGIRLAKGDVIVFLDASCVPSKPSWLHHLIGPILNEGEDIVRGSLSNIGNYVTVVKKNGKKVYVTESPTINMAVKKEVFKQIGTFDETFSYGSDMDFTWRATHRGYNIRYIESAPISHDFGSINQNMKRYLNYGKARAKLYFKHPYYVYRFKNYELISLIYFLILCFSPIVLNFPAYLIALGILLLFLLRGNGSRELIERISFTYGLILGFFDEMRLKWYK